MHECLANVYEPSLSLIYLGWIKALKTQWLIEIRRGCTLYAQNISSSCH